MAKEKVTFALTFFDIAYSLGGRSNVDKIYKTLNKIFSEEAQKDKIIKRYLLTEKELKVLEVMVETYKRDNMFPSWTFLQEAFDIVSNAPIRNVGDFNTALSKMFSVRSSEYMKMEVSNTLATSDDVDVLKTDLAKIQERYKGGESDRIAFTTFDTVQSNYDFAANAPQGIYTGIETIDKLTAGYQAGTIASFAGFTSHGKSTASNNCAYINALKGKKVGVISLEIVPLLCKYIYLSRHSYEMNKPIEYQNIIRAHLTEAERTMMFKEIEPDFIEKVGKNLVIVGTEDIPEYSYAGFELLYTMLEEAMGGLDLIVWDHVNQFKYVNPNSGLTGDHYIKMITDLTKTYINRNGLNPVSLLVVQTNREGFKRAARHEGRYELTALSDFNELEKSSTYVTFIYADEAQRSTGQAKVQLLKHRLGMVMLEPEIVDVAFEYSSVGGKFTDVIQTIMTDREAGINNTFFSGSGVNSGGFDMSDAFKDLETIKEIQKTNVEKVTLGTAAEQVPEEEQPQHEQGYVKKIITPNENDFTDFL